MTRKLRINRLYWPVTSLGFGHRAGIWFQGCSIGCADCGSKHTWRVEDGEDATVAEIIEWLDSLQADHIDGITISGGEPFEQPQNLLSLLKAIRSLHGELKDLDILVYSGYTWRRLSETYPDILKHIDTVISGPYANNRDIAWMRGSDNQEIHNLSPIGRRRYGNTIGLDQQNTLQIVVDQSEVRILGIPGRGDLDTLKARLALRGVRFAGELD